MSDDVANEPKPVKKRAPTLYAIIISKLVKGLSFACLAMALYALSDNDLNAEYARLLDNINHTPLLHAFIHVNPEKKFWVDVSKRVDALTEKEMVHAAIGTLVYGLFALVEAFGLMFRWPWAGWLSIGESAFFIPIEVGDLMRSFHPVIFLILIFNIFIVWYLFQNRERLFKAHD
jgi:uncharacterized membrane protein (DUF2068 family)